MLILKNHIRNLMGLVLLVASMAQAAEVQRHFGGADSYLLGLGLHQDLGEEIYLGAIYGALGDAEPSTETVSKIQMRILAEALSARRFNRLWLDAISLNSEREERNSESDAIMALGDLLKIDLMRGDRIDIDYLREENLVVFQLNDVVYGEIPGRGFYRLLLQAWLGQTPPSAQLKSGLLNDLSENEMRNLRSRYSALLPSENRQLTVSQQIDYVDFRERELQEALLAEQARLEQEKEEERLAALEAQLALLAEQKEERGVRLMAANRQFSETSTALGQLQQSYLENQTRLSLQYEQVVSSWIGQRMTYPTQASSRQIEGRVILGITINRLGEIIQVDMVESSNQAVLDRAALETIEGIQQMPPMPERLSAQTYTVNVPFNFRLD